MIVCVGGDVAVPVESMQYCSFVVRVFVIIVNVEVAVVSLFLVVLVVVGSGAIFRCCC